MDKIHNSDLVFISVGPNFRLLKSWNEWIEYIDCDFWKLNRAVESLWWFRKAILYSLQGDFPCVGMRRWWPKFTVGLCYENLLGIMMYEQFVYVAFIVKVFKLFYLQVAR